MQNSHLRLLGQNAQRRLLSMADRKVSVWEKPAWQKMPAAATGGDHVNKERLLRIRLRLAEHPPMVMRGRHNHASSQPAQPTSLNMEML
ncbi:hypothetical protein [Methylovulum psychrotolerans]|nr:hypothetical protein [Methylovulum psychrotolerans]